MKEILAKIFGPKLNIETIHAYIHKLPAKVEVRWKRETDFIVGEIYLNAGADPVYTQARTPKEFVRMVNDAIYITLNFRSEYIDLFHAKKDVYAPKPAEWESLNNGKTTQGSFGFQSSLSENFVPTAV